MKFPGLTKVLTAATLAVGSLTVNMIISQGGSTQPNQAGFWCQQGAIPKTMFWTQSRRAPKVWINWVSDAFVPSGYTPAQRCDTVSQKLNYFYQSKQLRLISLGVLNNQNVLCVAQAPGICKPEGDIFTLKPDQDTVETLRKFLTLLTEPGTAVEMFESSSGIPYIDVSSALIGDSMPENPPISNPVPNPTFSPATSPNPTFPPATSNDDDLPAGLR
jgi:hypothetical protein